MISCDTTKLSIPASGAYARELFAYCLKSIIFFSLSHSTHTQTHTSTDTVPPTETFSGPRHSTGKLRDAAASPPLSRRNAEGSSSSPPHLYRQTMTPSPTISRLSPPVSPHTSGVVSLRKASEAPGAATCGTLSYVLCEGAVSKHLWVSQQGSVSCVR